jgi:hypothetical protein
VSDPGQGRAPAVVAGPSALCMPCGQGGTTRASEPRAYTFRVPKICHACWSMRPAYQRDWHARRPGPLQAGSSPAQQLVAPLIHREAMTSQHQSDSAIALIRSSASLSGIERNGEWLLSR